MDPTQPQTLQAAVLLSYLDAALGILFFVIYGALPSLLLVALGVAAYTIANERKWGYRLGVVVACIYVLEQLAMLFVGSGFSGFLNLVFAAVLVVLLVHPVSRAYQRTFFH